MTVLDLSAIAASLNEETAAIAPEVNSAADVPTSPYVFFDDNGKVMDVLADVKTPEWVRGVARPIPVTEAGELAHPYSLAIAMKLLANVASGRKLTMLGKVFPYGSTKKDDGSFATAHPSTQTVEHSLVIAIPGFDASKPLGGIETAQFVPMKSVAKKVRGEDRYTVGANAMACRVKVNTNDAGEVVDFTIMLGARIAIRQSGGSQDDSFWTSASTSLKVKSLTGLSGRAKQAVACMQRLVWVEMYRQQLEDGEKAAGDVYHTALVTLSTNYYGVPFGAGDKDLAAGIHSRLEGLDDPSGRAKDLPDSYVWQGFSGIFA